MDPIIDLFCARQLVSNLFVTPEQVQEGFEIQRALRRDGGDGEPLVDILLAKGFIDLDQAQEVRDALAAAQTAGQLGSVPGTEAEASAKTGEGVPAGLEIPGIRVEARLRTTAVGVDFLGTHEKSGKRAAVHVLFPKYQRDPDARERFLEQARAWKAVAHENVAPLLETGASGARVYSAHLLPDGPTLAELAAEGPLPPDRVITIGRQVAEALAAMDAAGLHNGALRAEDVYVGPRDAVRVRFPVRPTTGVELRAADEAIAVPPQWDPDQEPPVGFDLYGLGVLLMQALLGHPPVAAEEDETVEDVLDRVAGGLPQVRELRGDVPAPLATLVDWCTSPDDAARPETADQVTTAFGMVAMGVEPQVGGAVRGAPVRRKRARRAAPKFARRSMPMVGGSRTARRPAPTPRGPARSPARHTGRGPAPRGGGAPGGSGNPTVWIVAGGGGLLLLIALFAAFAGSGPSRGTRTARNRHRTTRTTSHRKSRSKPVDPWADESATPAPAAKPKPKDDGGKKADPPPAQVDRDAAKEQEAADYVERARQALAKGNIASAAQILDYIDSNYAETTYVREHRTEIDRLKSEVMNGGGGVPPGGDPGDGPPAALGSGFTFVDCEPNDWIPRIDDRKKLIGMSCKKRGAGMDGHSALIGTVKKFHDLTMEVTASMRGDPAGGGIGLAFWVDLDKVGLYEFVVRNGGAYILYISKQGSRRVAGAAAGLPAQGTFELALVVEDDLIKGYVNGRLVVSTRERFAGQGDIGWVKYGNGAVEFSNLSVEAGAHPVGAGSGSGGVAPAPVPSPGSGSVGNGGGTAAPGDWKSSDGGRWSWIGAGIAEGRGEGLGSYGHAVLLDKDSGGTADFTATVSVKLKRGPEGSFAGIAVRSDGNRNGLEFYIYSVDGNTGWRLAKFKNEKWSKVDTGSAQVSTDLWVKLKVQVEGKTLRCWLDGRKVFDDTLPDLPTDGSCGLCKYGKATAQWRNIRFPVK